MTKTAKTNRTAALKKPAKPAPARKRKKPTKADQLVKLMSRPNGVSVDEALQELPMQIHSLRGLVSTVAKAPGLKVQ